MTGFMMQRGRMILCGNVGPGLGDSMYDGTIYVGGKVASLGIDCVPGEWTDADTEFIERKFRIHGLGSPPELQKFVCGKKLYNYDNLEPSERKLVPDGEQPDERRPRRTAGSSRPRSSTTSTSSPSSGATACAASRCSSRSRTGTS